MKNSNIIFALCIAFFCVTFFTGCKEEVAPEGPKASQGSSKSALETKAHASAKPELE